MGNNNYSGHKIVNRVLENRPQSTESRIIFPWCVEKKRFKKDDFSPEKTLGLVSLQDVNRVLLALRMNKYHNPQDQCSGYIIILIIFLVFAILFHIVMALSKKPPKDPPKKKPKHGGLRLLGEKGPFERIETYVFILLVSLLVFSCYWAWKKMDKQIEEKMMKRQEEFQKILDRFNEREFNQYNINWTAGELGAYLSLEIGHSTIKIPDNINKDDDGDISNSGLPFEDEEMQKFSGREKTFVNKKRVQID